MDNLFLAAMLANEAMNSTARSALPDAPVVPDVPRRRSAPGSWAARPRLTISRSLERLARSVAPAPNPGICHPAN
jgi:hypothetical protein